jgi:hypothetical protein
MTANSAFGCRLIYDEPGSFEKVGSVSKAAAEPPHSKGSRPWLPKRVENGVLKALRKATGHGKLLLRLLLMSSF